ncbi:MAG: roadblock/LC7 domain-containing protein [Promethearchaeota archaeon]
MDFYTKMLKKLLAAIPEVNAAAIVSTEGLPIASVLPYRIDETRIAAMTAALLSLAKRSVIEMEKGGFDQLYVKGSDGYLLVLQAGPNAVLTVSTTKYAKLGLIFLDCKRICEKIAHGDFDNHFPYPYVFKPPTPPGDLGLAGEPQVKLPKIEKIQEYEPYCKHCGAELPKGQTICHVCGKKVG